MPSRLQELFVLAKNGKPKLDNFKSWLVKNGAEVLAPTSEWEVARFRFNGTVAIIWKDKRNELTWNQPAREAWTDFSTGRTLRSFKKGPEMSSLGRAAAVPVLLERDGDLCVVCDRPLLSDVTIEHLLDRRFGGTDHIANLTLAHGDCNKSLSACTSLRDKIEIILKARSLQCT